MPEEGVGIDIKRFGRERPSSYEDTPKYNSYGGCARASIDRRISEKRKNRESIARVLQRYQNNIQGNEQDQKIAMRAKQNIRRQCLDAINRANDIAVEEDIFFMEFSIFRAEVKALLQASEEMKLDHYNAILKELFGVASKRYLKSPRIKSYSKYVKLQIAERKAAQSE